MKESDAARRAKERLAAAESRLATAKSDLADTQAEVLRMAGVIAGIESECDTLRYIVKGENGPAPAPAPKRTRKPRAAKTDPGDTANLPSVLPGTHRCLESKDVCDAKGAIFIPHIPGPGKRNAGVPVCPHCMSTNIKPVTQ